MMCKHAQALPQRTESDSSVSGPTLILAWGRSTAGEGHDQLTAAAILSTTATQLVAVQDLAQVPVLDLQTPPGTKLSDQLLKRYLSNAEQVCATVNVQECLLFSTYYKGRRCTATDMLHKYLI